MTHLDIVEGTYKMFKVETHKLLAPMKIYIKYRKRGAPIADKSTTI